MYALNLYGQLTYVRPHLFGTELKYTVGGALGGLGGPVALVVRSWCLGGLGSLGGPGGLGGFLTV